MTVSSSRGGSNRHRRWRAAVAFGALAGLALVAILLPAPAPAGQSSPPTPGLQVVAGVYHSCALVNDGTTPAPAGWPVRCWGYSGDGQLGYGNTRTIGDNEVPATIGPVDLGPGRTAKALAGGEYHTCAVLDDGTVRCWGYGNEGQLGYSSRSRIGDDETPAQTGAVYIGTGRTATAITAGGNHTCAVLDDGSVRCWGFGDFGQLGYGTKDSIGDTELPGSVGPVDLGAGRTAKAITAGALHTCAILDDNSVRCWGRGDNGQLGYGNTQPIGDDETPGSVGPVNLGGHTAKAITAGFAHTCVILDDNSVRCWGLSDRGQLGYGNKQNIGDNETPASVGPVDLGPGHTAIAISAGGKHTCAVLDNGSLLCWGWGVSGQLGYGNLNDIGDDETPASAGPVDIGAGRTATAVVAGIYHTCVRLDDRSVRCWGNGADGRLGLCSTANIGDNETPASVKPVDLGAGGAACAATKPPPTTPGGGPPTGGGTPVAPSAPLARLSDEEKALRAEQARAGGLRGCRAAARGRVRRARSRARRRYRGSPHRRALALRRVARLGARGRARCLRRFGRKPGRVTTLAARPGSEGTIVLTLRAPGSDGSSLPPARSYLVKQSLRPIRTRRDFKRAHALCKGACTFDVTKLDAAITLNVTNLRRRTTYYYSIAARDNVSKRTGPRSKTVRAKTS